MPTGHTTLPVGCAGNGPLPGCRQGTCRRCPRPCRLLHGATWTICVIIATSADRADIRRFRNLPSHGLGDGKCNGHLYWAQVAITLGVPDPRWLYDQLAPHEGELAIVGAGLECGGAVDSLLAGLAWRLSRPGEAAERAQAARWRPASAPPHGSPGLLISSTTSMPPQEPGISRPPARYGDRLGDRYCQNRSMPYWCEFLVAELRHRLVERSEPGSVSPRELCQIRHRLPRGDR